jgi:isoquinoline 1-oxidoreductase beta subunit
MQGSDASLTPLLKIGADNQIIFYYPSPEMGQGVDTSLAMLFAEELDADWSTISVIPMDYLIRLNDKQEIEPVTVPQFAGGSTSISRNFSLLREAGAQTRARILQAAAKKWSTKVETLNCQDSYVIAPDKRRLSYGELAASAANETLAEDFEIKLKPVSEWRIAGTAKSSKQAIDIVTGKPLYGMDMHYPGAKIALVQRSPWFDGDVLKVNTAQVMKLPGVHAVVTLKRPAIDKYYTYLAAGVAVIADDFWTAKKARDALIIEWDKGPNSNESSSALNRQAEELLKTSGQIVRDDGDFKEIAKSAQSVFSRTYQTPFVSHAQLEPQNCIADVRDNRCKIIGPFQSPGGASRLVAQITGLPRTSIDIQYTRLGGGFGRRLNSDHAAEAVTISMLAAMPVKLIWTREDDMAHDFYRPMGHHHLTAAVDDQANIVGWSHRLAATPKHYRREGRKLEELYDADLYIDDFPAGLVDNLQLEYLMIKSAVPQGSWRAPAHTANAFVIQSFLDELAHELGQDPLEIRLKLLGEDRELPYSNHGGPTFSTGRLSAVLQKVADMSSWGRQMPAGTGLGIAGHFTFGGYCAQVAEVELKPNNQFRVKKIWAAIDVGTVINQEGVKAQLEGGINDGLSTALEQAILIQNGQVVTKNFDSYKMMRINDSVTQIESFIVDSSAEPSGAGEMSIPPTAPAVANALRAAGGPRIRRHPMKASMSS